MNIINRAATGEVREGFSFLKKLKLFLFLLIKKFFPGQPHSLNKILGLLNSAVPRSSHLGHSNNGFLGSRPGDSGFVGLG